MTRKASKKPAPAPEVCPVIGGEVIMFLYPKHPFTGVTGPLEPHFGRVTDVRDLCEDRLSNLEIEENPTLVRSRFLITCVAPETGAMSTFFSDYMEQLQHLRPGLMVSRMAPLWSSGRLISKSEGGSDA